MGQYMSNHGETILTTKSLTCCDSCDPNPCRTRVPSILAHLKLLLQCRRGSHFEPIEIDSDRVIDPTDVPLLSCSQSSAKVRAQLSNTHLLEEIGGQNMEAESPHAPNV